MSNELINAGRQDALEAEHGFDLRETLSFIWRQWKFVAAITIVVFLIGTVFLVRETPLYTATSQVLLDRQQGKPPGGDAILAGVNLDAAMVESEMAIIQSTVLLRRVVEKNHLAAEPAAAAGVSADRSAEIPSFVEPALSYVHSLIGSTWAGQPNPQTNPQTEPAAPAIVGSDPTAANEERAIAALKGSLKVSRAAQSGYVLAISFTSPDRAKAARLANAVADAYLVDKLDTRFEAAKRASAWLSDSLLGLRQQLRESEEAVSHFRTEHGLVQSGGVNLAAIRLRELERTAAVNKTLFEDFLKQAKITQEQSTFEPQEVRVITPALPPGQQSYPHTTRFMLVNLFIGLSLGVGGALAKEKLNTGFTTPKQIEDMLGLPLLTSVSHLTGRDLTVDRAIVPVHNFPTVKPLSRYGEAIRSLRSGVHMTDVDHPPKVIQMTSAVPGEGKTTIAMSFAASAANAKLKVLFVDADLRHPTATRHFGLQKEPGLVDLLLGEVAVEDVIRFYQKGGYWALGAGNKTQNPTDLLGSARMKAMVATFREAYDLVVIDTPAAGPVTDPVVVSHLSDQIVLIVRWGKTARELVGQCVNKLSGHTKIAGVAFNQVDDRQAQKYGKYAYSYYYGARHYKDYYS
jgi:capsular exopolysaccharide synthesis family protein